MGALISDCGNYRYWLTRPAETIFAEKGTALFLMLNPSTADAELDDPTIRRCRGFARIWGCNGLTVANLYAYRSTEPKNLWKAKDPVGPLNNHWLKQLAGEYIDIVCAWGENAHPDRIEEVTTLLRAVGARLWCLGTTNSGAPRHPLYVRADQELIHWEG